MKKYLLGLFAVVLAVGFSSFTAKKHEVHSFVKDGKLFVNYWYTFTGTQSQAGRQDKTKYINPSTTKPSCSVGSVNECTVQVSIASGTPPTDISTLNVTFDSGVGGTGFPNGGTDFVSNATKLL